MAKIEFKDKKISEKRLTLGDCGEGDIVLLNEKIYIIIEKDYVTSLLLNLATVDQEEFHNDAVCACYQKSLCFSRSDFKEYIS